MTLTRKFLSVFTLATVIATLTIVGLASVGGAFTRQGAFQNGEGHCANGPAGLTSQTRIIVRPKTLNPVVSGPWAVQRVEQHLNKDQTMIHLIGPASLTSGVEIVNGVPVDIVIENRALCGDVPPPPPTCEELGNCPPIPCEQTPEGCPAVPCEETDTCPPVPSCETDETLCPPEVPEVPETPEVPELIPPVVVSTPAPSPPAETVTTPPTELAFTGSNGVLAAVGLVALAIGAALVHTGSDRKAKRGLNV